MSPADVCRRCRAPVAMRTIASRWLPQFIAFKGLARRKIAHRVNKKPVTKEKKEQKRKGPVALVRAAVWRMGVGLLVSARCCLARSAVTKSTTTVTEKSTTTPKSRVTVLLKGANESVPTT